MKCTFYKLEVQIIVFKLYVCVIPCLFKELPYICNNLHRPSLSKKVYAALHLIIDLKCTRVQFSVGIIFF